MYTCYRDEITFKESEEHISDNFLYARPLPADSGHILHQQKSKKSRKIIKNAIFQKSIFCDIVAENMIFGRKLALWAPESTQKPYIDLPTQYGYISQKVKKNRIFHPKNHGKKFFEADFFGRCGPATKPILGIDTSYWCPQDPIILLYWPHSFLPKSSLKNSKKFEKNVFFHESVVFVAFVAFWVLLMLFFKISKIRRYC